MATDQLPALPGPTIRDEGAWWWVDFFTADQMRAYALAAIAADRARAVPVASGEVAVLAMVTFTMLGDLMGDEAPPEAIEFAKELYPRIDEIQEFAPDNADVLRVAMTHLRAWMSGAHAPSEQPADLSIQAAGEREAFEQFFADSRHGKGQAALSKLLERMPGGDYVQDHTQRHWWTWQKARASLSTPASGEGWKPIETAPTERCMCLVLIGEQVHVAQFNPRTVSAQWWNAYGIPSRLAHTPTHWRPLPPAPTSTTEPAASSHANPSVATAGPGDQSHANPESTEPAAPLKGCAANRDGDCVHAQCPQLRDGEPRATGRHCPLDTEPAAEGGA